MRGTIKDKVYNKREKEGSKLRMGGKSGSWTILMDVIDNPKVEKIVYRTEKKKYEISKQDTHYGTFDRFLGGEHKRIVPIDKWQVSAI